MGNCNNIYSIIGIDKHGICLRIPVLLPPHHCVCNGPHDSDLNAAAAPSASTAWSLFF